MSIFFTSDLHLNHKGILQYCNRPFSSVEEMNETIISNWNKKVSKKDFIYIVGDFSFFKNQQDTVDVINKLNGAEKHLILGNHDSKMKLWVKEKFTSCSHYKEINIPDEEVYGKKQFIVLSHYAFRVFNKSHYGAINLHGHSHGTLEGNSQQLDVGVDCWNFSPVSYEEIKEKLKTLPPFKKQDKHGDL